MCGFRATPSDFFCLVSFPPQARTLTPIASHYDIPSIRIILIIEHRRIPGELAKREGGMALASIIPSSTRQALLPTTFSPCLVRFRFARFPSIRRQEETDVWGTLTKENSVIFHDNDVSAFCSNFSAWFVPRVMS